MTDITELAQLRDELLSPAIGSSAHLRKIALSLVDELEKAQQHIAELESRTVKLPDLRQSVSGDRYVWSDGVYNYSQDVKEALAAAGIKWEAE